MREISCSIKSADIDLQAKTSKEVRDLSGDNVAQLKAGSSSERPAFNLFIVYFWLRKSTF